MIRTEGRYFRMTIADLGRAVWHWPERLGDASVCGVDQVFRVVAQSCSGHVGDFVIGISGCGDDTGTSDCTNDGAENLRRFNFLVGAARQKRAQ